MCDLQPREPSDAIDRLFALLHQSGEPQEGLFPPKLQELDRL